MSGESLYNNTRATTRMEENDKKAILAIPSMIYIIVFMIAGIIGNSFVVYVYGFRFKKGTINTFIVSLALFDLLNCCLAMPFEIVDDRYPLVFPSSILCKLLRFISFFTTGASCFTLVAIGIDRHRRICRPLRKQISLRQVRIIVSALAIAAAAFVCPILELAGFDTYSNVFPGMNITDCSIADKHKNSLFPVIYFGYLFFIILVSFAVMSVAYILIWVEVRRRFANKVGDEIQMKKEDDLENDKSSNKSKKTLKMMSLVTLVFILSFIPSLVIQIVRATVIGFGEEMNIWVEVFFNIGLRSYFIQNALNPFIYGYCNNKFRKEVQLLFGYVCGQHKKVNIEDSTPTPSDQCNNTDETV